MPDCGSLSLAYNYKTKGMNRKQSLGKAPYSSPETSQIRLHAEHSILILSGDGTSLSGSGVDESNADNNGGNVW